MGASRDEDEDVELASEEARESPALYQSASRYLTGLGHHTGGGERTELKGGGAHEGFSDWHGRD